MSMVSAMERNKAGKVVRKYAWRWAGGNLYKRAHLELDA